MNTLVTQVVNKLRSEKKIPGIIDPGRIPVPAVNKVELYLTLNCNDYCPHCITNSGPGNTLTLQPDAVEKIIKNIKKFSILNHLGSLLGPGRYSCIPDKNLKQLETLAKPPGRLDRRIKEAYSAALQGREDISFWTTEKGEEIKLPFGRPSLRLSGGEFFQWPHRLNGEIVETEDRLEYQKKLLDKIREDLPYYDIWILTNGKFAGNLSITDKTIEKWTNSGKDAQRDGKTRICISLDMFHTPPPNSTVEDMLYRIWTSCKRKGACSPFLYGVPNNRISLLGRAFKNFGTGMQREKMINRSGSLINPVKDLVIDPVDLISSDGCNEVKGFLVQQGHKSIIANNIVVSPEGNLVFCCACLGNYGDFVSEPEKCLKNLVVNPVSLMLRKADTATELLNTAVKLDPSIKIFGKGIHPAVTGSTCYQMISGERID